MWLFLLFIAVPLIEIALFIQVGGAIGLLPTLVIVVITAVLGTTLVRSQGAMALGQLRQSFETLHDPAEPLAHGAMILFAGALLLTPGFFTDAVGFAFLVPGVRSAVIKQVRARIKVQSFQMGPDPRHRPSSQPGGTGRGPVIDGEFTELDDTPPQSDGQSPSGWTKH